MKLHQHYKSDAVSTATPAGLVTLLYDRALQGLTVGGQAIDSGQRDVTNRELQHVQRILTELLVTLDHERGGEIASNLDAIYRYCLERLVHANTNQDRAAVDEVQTHVAEIRDAWVQAAASVGAG